MTRWLAGAAVLLPLLVAGNIPCPEPDYPAVEDCPFPVDPNLVAGTLLGWVRLEVGQRLTHTRTWCDAEGDPAEVEIVAAPQGVQIINRPNIRAYTLLWVPTQPMTAAIVVRITDRPAHGDAKSATGTILVQVVPRGGLASGGRCGGRPG